MSSREPWAGERIGNLRERITLVKPGEPVQDPGSGEWIPGEPEAFPVQARVQPIKGMEVIQAGGVEAIHEMTFHVRYMADVTPLWSIEWAGRTYNVSAVRNPDERRRFLAIEAKAVAT